MKKTKKQPTNKGGGYRLPRDSEGMTPRQRLDTARAKIAEIELAEKRGELVAKSEIDRKLAADAEVVKSDLLHTLPQSIAGHAIALKCDQSALREVAKKCVIEIMQQWQKSELL